MTNTPPLLEARSLAIAAGGRTLCAGLACLANPPTEPPADAATTVPLLGRILCGCDILKLICQGGMGRLYLHLSRDGVHFEPPHLLDEEPGQWMPYSTFLADEGDRETNDMSTVGAEFYVLINHKSAQNYGIDSLHRRKISVSRK